MMHGQSEIQSLVMLFRKLMILTGRLALYHKIRTISLNQRQNSVRLTIQLLCYSSSLVVKHFIPPNAMIRSFLLIILLMCLSMDLFIDVGNIGAHALVCSVALTRSVSGIRQKPCAGTQVMRLNFVATLLSGVFFSLKIAAPGYLRISGKLCI